MALTEAGSRADHARGRPAHAPELALWIGGLAVLVLSIALAGGELSSWVRRNARGPSSHLPALAAAVVATTAALRIGWLVHAREHGALRAVFALSASLQAWAGVFAGVFVLACAFTGTVGLRGEEYLLALDTSVGLVLATALLVVLELGALVHRACVRSPARSVHLVGPLAWLLAPVAWWNLGLGFFLTT